MARPKDNWMRTRAGGYISLSERYSPPEPPDRGTRIRRSKTLTLWVWLSYMRICIFGFWWVKVAIDVIKVYI